MQPLSRHLTFQIVLPLAIKTDVCFLWEAGILAVACVPEPWLVPRLATSALSASSACKGQLARAWQGPAGAQRGGFRGLSV